MPDMATVEVSGQATVNRCLSIAMEKQYAEFRGPRTAEA